MISASFTDDDGIDYEIEAYSIPEFVRDVSDYAIEGGSLSNLVIDTVSLPGTWFFRWNTGEEEIQQLEKDINEMIPIVIHQLKE